MSTERMEAFSDGVFAVAITLLILDVHVPFMQHGALVLNARLWRALTDQWVSYVTYIVSFIIIGIMWRNCSTQRRCVCAGLAHACGVGLVGWEGALGNNDTLRSWR